MSTPSSTRFGRFLDWYWAHFLCGFCYHVPLPLMLLLHYALLQLRLGSEYGVEFLIYHGDPYKRFAVGFALGVVALQTLFVGYLLAGEVRGREENFPARRGPARYTLGIGICFVGSLLFIYLLTVLAKLVVWATTGEPTLTSAWLEAPAWSWILFAGMITAALLALLVYLVFHGLKRFAPTLPRGGALGRWMNDHIQRRYAQARLQAGLENASILGRADWINRGWLLLLGLYLYGGYLAVAWTFYRTSRFDLRLLAFVAVIVFVPLLAFLLFPLTIGRLVRLIASQIDEPRHPDPNKPVEESYRFEGIAFSMIGLFLLISISFIPKLSSPAVAVCVPLFLLVTLYGIVRAVVRYRTPLIWAAALVAIIIGGSDPYKFRFRDLSRYYSGPVEQASRSEDEIIRPADPIDPDQLLDLVAQSQHDDAVHRAYFAVITKAMADPEYQSYLQELNALRRRDPNLLRAESAPEWRRINARRLAIEDRAAGGPVPMAGLREAFSRTRVLPGKDLRAELLFRPSGTVPDAGPLLDVYAIRHHGEGQTANLVKQFRADRASTLIEPRPLILIAVSGGGLRSAAWTLTVLHELERRFAREGIDFPAHVRVIAGASGGMLGASYYVTTLPAASARVAIPQTQALPEGREQEMTEGYQDLTADFLTPLVNRLVYSDLPAMFSPFPIERDRGQVLEDTWNERLKLRPSSWVTETAWFKDSPPERKPSALDVPFHVLRRAEAAAEVPSLVFSPMLVEDGRRLLVSNLDLKAVASNDGSRLTGGEVIPGNLEQTRNFSHDALELFRMFPRAANDFRVGTAVRMSASFPYFSPAVTLPTVPRRRVVDAGYYDNYGVSLAAAWLFSGNNRQWIRQHVSRVLLIQIRDGADDVDRRLMPRSSENGDLPTALEREQSSSLSRSIEELTTPPIALYNARVGSSSYRNDGLLELLSSFFQEADLGGRRTAADSLRPLAHAERFFSTALFEFPGDASLSWYLTDRQRAALRINPDAFSLSESEREQLRKEAEMTKTRVDRTISDILIWWKANDSTPKR